jgi:uncharacterized membrane protein
MHGREDKVPFPARVGLTVGDLRHALAAGWRDFAARPLFGLFFASFYVLGGLAMLGGLDARGQGWWLIVPTAGFPLVAPFAAVGLYEVSRRREAGLPLRWGAVLGVLRGEQLIMMAGLLFVAFSFWMILAHGVFAIFMGTAGAGLASMHTELFASPEGIAMLAVGGVVGGLFALALFSVTVISLPMLVDRDIDFITAMIASLATVRANPGVTLAWAVIIAVTLTIAMIPAFLGLFVALPVLGHATWHLYRRAIGAGSRAEPGLGLQA